MTGDVPIGPHGRRSQRGGRALAGIGAASLAALAITGCTSSSAVTFDDATVYRCLSHTIDADTLAAATPVADLAGETKTMVTEARWDDGRALALRDEDAWYVAALTGDSLLIMRTLPEDEVGVYGPPGSDREVIEVSQIEGDADGWDVVANSYCPLTIDLGGLAVPTVELDGARAPGPATTDLHLLVTETACNSGLPAEGRVRLVSLLETEHTVTVTIGVEPRAGAHTCQGNPPTPFTVTLDGPLGERTLVDGTRGVPLGAP